MALTQRFQNAMMPGPDDTQTKPSKTLMDRVTGPRVTLGQMLSVQSRASEFLVALPFSPLDTRNRLAEGLENGAFATVPLTALHSFMVLVGIFTEDWATIVRHSTIAAVSVIFYYAILRGRTPLPSILLFGWITAEIVLGPVYLEPPFGISVFTLTAWPCAVLAVRASLKRGQQARSREGSYAGQY